MNRLQNVLDNTYLKNMQDEYFPNNAVKKHQIKALKESLEKSSEELSVSVVQNIQNVSTTLNSFIIHPSIIKAVAFVYALSYLIKSSVLLMIFISVFIVNLFLQIMDNAVLITSLFTYTMIWIGYYKIISIKDDFIEKQKLYRIYYYGYLLLAVIMIFITAKSMFVGIVYQGTYVEAIDSFGRSLPLWFRNIF